MYIIKSTPTHPHSTPHTFHSTFLSLTHHCLFYTNSALQDTVYRISSLNVEATSSYEDSSNLQEIILTTPQTHNAKPESQMYVG